MRAHGRERRMGKRFALVHGAWHVRSTWLRRVLAVCVAATALSLALGWSATGAQAADVSCGDTITADTTLHKDLVDCPNNGIVIGADDITLDLNDHTIDGDGTGSGVSWEFATHDGITVKHGSIRQFETGLDAVGSRHIRLLGLAVSRNHSVGIALAAAARVLVRNCSANHTTARERHGSSGRGLLVTTASGPGLAGRGGPSHHVRIVNSSFRHNAGDGIRSFFTTDNVIEGNLLSGNGGTGIAWRGSRNRLSRNRIVGGETGITVHGSQNVVARNRVSDSRHDGVGILAGRGNLLAGNVIAGAATGIRLSGEVEPGRGGPMNTVIRGNSLRRAREDGLLVVSTAKHTLLRHNSARHSQDDGFDVNDPTTKLTKNRAIRNGDLGIEAVRGVIDGGGNIARHNRDPRQCTHISCS
jgi:parallel beta-helix repeat protein